MKLKYYLLLVLSLNISLLLNAQSGITPYSLPDADGQFFSVKVNGIDVPVKSYKDFEYVHFAMSESAEIVITAPDSVGTIFSHRIRPERRDISGTVQDNTLSFSIDKPQQLVVNINFLKKLMIFADPPEVDIPSLSDANVVNIMNYGVDATGGSLITTKFQQAIDELPAGGTLYFPAGLYRTGSITLKGNMTLYLAPGALIKGSDTPTDIKFLPPSFSVLYFFKAEDADNITIRGRGALDGNGKVVRKILDAENGGKKVPGRLVYLKNSDSFSLKGVFLRDSYSWNTNLIRSSNVHVDRVKIINDFTLSNGDGIDVDGCVNVLVENSFIYAEDDAISPKATSATVNPEKQVYRNCVLWSNIASGIRMGTETYCDHFSDILFENIDILFSGTMINLFTYNTASFRDITFRNIWVEDYGMYYDPRYDEFPPRVLRESGHTYLVYIYDKTPSAFNENIRFENLVSMGRHVKSRFDALGATTTRIDNIHFANFIVGNDTLMNATDAKFEIKSGVGTITFLKDEGISTNSRIVANEISLNIYPNPVQGMLNIDAAKPISAVRLYNLSGKMVKTFRAPDYATTIDLSSLISGLYFVEVQFTNKNSCWRKIVVKSQVGL